MFGMGYVINHCIAHFQKEQKETLKTKSLVYIAQGIECLVNGLANDSVMKPFSEFVGSEEVDERTSDEIVEDVLDDCGF